MHLFAYIHKYMHIYIRDFFLENVYEQCSYTDIYFYGEKSLKMWQRQCLRPMNVTGKASPFYNCLLPII